MPLDPASVARPSRRNVLAGFAALAAALPASKVLGQEASPVSDAVEELLFVQVAESGTAEPIAGQSGQYALTLANSSGQTLYFSDRPERLAGIFTTSDFISDAVSAAVRPNAALVFRTGGDDSQMKVAALELSDPAYDATSGLITYVTRLLDFGNGALTSEDPSTAVDTLPAEFGEATLFIDNFDIFITGFVNGKPLHGSIDIGRTGP